MDLSQDILLSQCDLVRQKIEKILNENFGIHHVTLQLEFNACDTKEVIHQNKGHYSH